MERDRRQFLYALAFTVAAAGIGSVSAQEGFPGKVIRIVAPASGGGSDVVARTIAPGLAAAFGQQVIVDNRGAIATEIVAKAPPDGHTLLVNGSPLWLLPLMRPVNYDAFRDFAPVTLAVSSPSMLVAHPSLPVRTVRDVIALAKARPGEINYAAGTLGASPHLAGETFKAMAGVNIVRVPYKGSGPALLGVMTGEVSLMFPGAASAWALVKQGRLRGIAICTLEPSPLFPGVPTVAQTGLPGFESVSPQTVVAPARTPPAIVNRLHGEIARVLNAPDVKARLANLGIGVVASTPEAFAAKMKADVVRVAKLVKAAGLRQN